MNICHKLNLFRVAKKARPKLKKPLKRWFPKFHSENTFNSLSYWVFYYGYVTQMYPVGRPVRQKFGDLGQVVLVQHSLGPYQKFIRGIGVCGLGAYVLFQLLQMIRFVPTEGFTLRVVYVIYYFVMQLLTCLLAYINFKYGHLLLYVWNCIEANTKMCQRYEVGGAAKWKYSPMTLLVTVPTVLGLCVMAVAMILLFAVKPNLPAHMFYLLPEKWKSYTVAYVTMVIWQAFMVMTAASSVNFMVTIGLAFVFGTKGVAAETASSERVPIPAKLKIFRAVEMVNQIANEICRNVFFPVLSFCTVATGVTFTYVALTRYGDPHLGLTVYTAVVVADVLTLGLVTTAYVQIGKYSDASAELIESIRVAMKKKEMLESPNLPYLRKQLAALRPFDLHVGSYAKINVETVKLLHETIVDYLMLLLSY